MLFGFGRKGTEGIGCYGKLPLHGDYVSHQGDAPEARRLTAWISDGYRLTGGHDDRHAAETRFCLPGKKSAVYGVTFPSVDKSGTRRFPFALFAELPEKPLAALGAAIPLALVKTWDSMTAAFPGLEKAATLEAVHTELGKIEVAALPDPAAVRDGLGPAAAACAVDEKARAVYFDAVRLAGALRADAKGPAPAFAVRIPLATGAPETVETAAWLTVLARLFADPQIPARSGLFLRPRRETRGGEVFLFHRDLRPEDLGFVLSPTQNYEFGNLLGDAPEAKENEEAGKWLAAKVKGDVKLSHLLDMNPAGFPG